MENQSTAVVENPYGLTPEPPAGHLLGAVLLMLIIIASGAAAARIGPRVAAWRGGVSGVLAGIGLAALTMPVRHVEEMAAMSLIFGLLAWLGGGFAKLFSSPRLRRLSGSCRP